MLLSIPSAPFAQAALTLLLLMLTDGASSETVAAPPVVGQHQALHAQIRQSRLSRLRERLTQSPETLQQRCRYESDISTAPPAGLVALTFDDGPDPAHSEQLLAVLAHYDIPASFFFIGEKMQAHPELVQKVMAGGRHLVASHSWSHPNFHDLDEAAQKTDLMRGLAQMPASQESKLFRYPFGNSTCFGNELVHAQGYRIVGWHVDSCDWAFDRTGTVALHEAVSCGVSVQHRSDFVGHVSSAVLERHGGIVLMHEIHANTLAQLGKVIDGLRAAGFSFVRVDDPRLGPSLR